MRGYLHGRQRHDHSRQMCHVRHDTGHADQRVDAAKGDRDSPETRRANDAFRESFIPGGKREHRAITVCVTFVDISPRVVL